MSDSPSVILHKGDLPEGLNLGDSVAVDTESMGLNWQRDRLCLVQLSSGDGTAHLVQFASGYDAPRLKTMFQDSRVTKIFHFARADLTAIRHYLGVMPGPVYCTKVASVIARTFTDRHGLKDLARDLLGIDLAKEQQTSDWGAPDLTAEQRIYAASDVLHLHALRARLDAILEREGRRPLAQAAFDFIPARVELDLAGWAGVNVFAHRPVARGG